ATQGVGENGGHALLDVGILAALGMPAVGDAAGFLGVGGVEQADLFAGDRMRGILGEADVFVELDHGQTPLGSELADGGVVGHAGVVPMRAEDDDGGLAGLGLVEAGLGVVAQGVALGQVALDDVVVGGGVVGLVEGRLVVGPGRLELRGVKDVLVVHLHDDEGVHGLQFFRRVERALGHAVGGVGDGLAADGAVDGGDAETAAAHLE